MQNMSRRGFIKGGIWTGLGVTASAAAIRHLSHVDLRVTRHQLAWDTARKITVLHLTDIHVGWSTPQSLLAEVQRRAHALQPDVVVMTGDYVNRSLEQLRELEAFVAGLPKPCFATLGNHDHWSGAAQVTEALRRGGARVLQNESAFLERDGFVLPIVGVDDGRTHHDQVGRAFGALPNAREALVLSHFPRTARVIAPVGGRLILSGHTHAGQFALPVATRALWSAIGEPFLAGTYQLGEAQLYVNAGVGHSRGGLRTGRAAPELAVFELG